jgi:hypothetical protein
MDAKLKRRLRLPFLLVWRSGLRLEQAAAAEKADHFSELAFVELSGL